jgi:hypothetical protein
MQSNDEILRVFTDWKTFHAPKNLIDNENTTTLLADYIAKNHGGSVSFTSLNFAVATLGPKVITPEPTEKEKAAAFAKKMEAKMRADYQNSIKQKSVVETKKNNAQDAAEAKKAADAKELANLKSEIAREIDTHMVGHHSGGVNYTRTYSERNTLRNILAQHKCDTIEGAKHALSAVVGAKNKLSR